MPQFDDSFESKELENIRANGLKMIEILRQTNTDNLDLDESDLAFIEGLKNMSMEDIQEQLKKEPLCCKKTETETDTDKQFLEILENMNIEDDTIEQKLDDAANVRNHNLKVMYDDIEKSKATVYVDVFLHGVQQEYERASVKHKKFNSYHEGLAVIWEEFEELKQEIFKKKPDEDNLNSELEQIAAMCLKFYNNLMRPK